MNAILSGLVKKCVAPAGVKAMLAVAALGAIPTSAMAGHDRDDDRHYRDDDRRYSERHEDHGAVRFDVGRVGFDIRFGERPIIVAAPPVCEERTTQVWVEPVYRTVSDRRWVEPQYTTVTERVWCPDQIEVREVRHGRRIVRERVCIVPGHFDLVTRQQQVCDGRWENVDRQECVAQGHYETRIVRVEQPR